MGYALTGFVLAAVFACIRPASAETLPEAAGAASAAATAERSEDTASRIDTVVVTADRIERGADEVPAHVTVIDRRRIEESAAITVDDLLRSVPGFHLFRRQSSLAANPTSQGVTMRGLGPNAASRALVLVDGIPLNDPFGGWVYWSKIPTENIERIELVRGGGSSVWGNSAMGGVIHIITKKPSETYAGLSAEGGNRGTADVQGLAAGQWGKWNLRLDGDYFRTGGYYLVPGGERVAFDTRADSEHAAGGLRLERAFTPGNTAHLEARYFHEDRDNGTELTGNDTKSGFFRAGVSGETAGRVQYEADVFGTVQTYESTFSAQDRATGVETPALDQFDVPSSSVGASARWWRTAFVDHRVMAGLDYRFIDGDTREDYRNLGDGFTRRRKAGGHEQFFGAYAQDVYRALPRLEITAALRFDVWRSSHGKRKERDLETGTDILDVGFDARTETFLSPKVGLLYRATDALDVRAAFYRAFRAPTLNELYRPFRVRNDITEANSDLDLEKLTGAEAGFDYAWGRLGLGATGFWNRLDDPVANVTVGAGPGDVPPCGFVPDGGVCRQRQNLGHNRILGAEIEAYANLRRDWDLSVSYAYTDAEIRSASANPDLEGNRVPQVPEHQVVVRTTYRAPWRAFASVEFRYVDSQYENDQNTLRLDDYVVVDATLGKSFGRGWEAFVRAQNVFGDRYEVGKTADGLVTLGPPAIVVGGLRYRFSR